MANAFVSSASWSNLIIPAYDRAVEFALREMPTFRAVVDKRPTNVTNPGATVTFTFHKDLAVSTTPLNEITDPDSMAVANPDRVNVTINEYGGWLQETLYLQETAFTKPSMEKAVLLARHQQDTLDALVRAILDGQDAGHTTDVSAGSGAAANISAENIMKFRTKLRSLNVPFKDGSSYVAYIHPDIAFDIMKEGDSSAVSWQKPHTYGGDTGGIYAAELGRYSAVRFVESTRCATSGTGTAKVYTTYVMGSNALVEANAIEPHTVVGNIVDPLKRKMPLGWHGLLGWSIFRPDNFLLFKAKSSIN